jgi:LacI family transcriptional regulator
MFTVYRRAGFHRAMKACGLGVEGEWEGTADLTERGGYAVATRLLTAPQRPTAIVACNDLMAIGAMRAAREQGLRVGQDLSVVGFDDIPAAEHTHPPLTTVRQPIYEIGQRVCRMLAQVLAGEQLTTEEHQVLLKPELVIRDSTGPPFG